MSRIGKNPIEIPAGVDVTINGADVTVKGPKGTLSHVVPEPISAAIDEGKVVVTRPSDDRVARSLHGLTRTLIANMIEGVTKGFSKQLEIAGTGYRVVAKGKDLEFSLGFSHTVFVPAPEGSSSPSNLRRSSTVSASTSSSLERPPARIRKLEEA